MVNDIRHRQEHIEFLESYIVELTEKIDELTEGRDYEKMIRSIEYRIEVLEKSDGCFNGLISGLKSELNSLNKDFDQIKPIIDRFDEERAFYRCLQSSL